MMQYLTRHLDFILPNIICKFSVKKINIYIYMLELLYLCAGVHILNMVDIYHYSQECVDLFCVSEHNLNLNHITRPLDKIRPARMKNRKSGSGALNQQSQFFTK